MGFKLWVTDLITIFLNDVRPLDFSIVAYFCCLFFQVNRLTYALLIGASFWWTQIKLNLSATQYSPVLLILVHAGKLILNLKCFLILTHFYFSLFFLQTFWRAAIGGRPPSLLTRNELVTLSQPLRPLPLIIHLKSTLLTLNERHRDDCYDSLALYPCL